MRAIEAALVCAKCGETNHAGGAHLIELDARTLVANCAVCSWSWVVPADAMS